MKPDKSKADTKQKADKAKRLVEVSSDFVELPAGAVQEPSSADASALQSAEIPALTIPQDLSEIRSTESIEPASYIKVSTANSEAINHIPTPATALKNTVRKALPFVLISLLVFCIPFLFSPAATWLNYPQVRTYMLCALIWNLIGAALYAQVEKRPMAKFWIILIFALPLIASHEWAPFMYTVEMILRGILSAPL